MAGLDGGISSSGQSRRSNPSFTVQHQDHIRYRNHQDHVRSRHHPGRVRRGSKSRRFGGAPGSAAGEGNEGNGGSTWGQLPLFRAHFEGTDKTTFSQRQRLRRAGALLDASVCLPDGVQPPVKHRVKSGITFSERQRQRKRGLLRYQIQENEVLDAVEQLFPGTHVDFTHPSYSPYDSDASDFYPVPLVSRLRFFVQRRYFDATRKAVALTEKTDKKPSSPTSGLAVLPRGKPSHVGSKASDCELFNYDTRIPRFEDGLVGPGDSEELSINSGGGVGASISVLHHQSGLDTVQHRLPGFVPIARAEPQTQLEICDQQESQVESGEPDTAPARHRRDGFKLKLRLGQAGRRLLSGAIAGAVSRTAVAPLETIRTHLMVGSHGHSVKDVFQWIMAHEGWTGLFRGNAINVIRVAPSKAIEVRHTQM